MSWDPDFEDMLPHTIEIQAWDGTYTENGQPNHNPTAVSYSARVSGKKISARRAESEGDNQDIFDIWFTASAGTKITVNDKVTLPNEQVFSEDRTPVIFAVGRIADEDGQHHVKLQCGWRYHRQGQ